MKITDYIVKIGLEAIKNKGISLEKEEIIKQRLTSFIERQHQVNISCTLEEELDFAKLSNYICTKLPSEIEVCLFGEKKEREIAHSAIISKAISYAQANTKHSKERTVMMMESAFDIIRDFYKSQTDKDLLFVAVRIEDTLVSDNKQQIDKQTREVASLLKQSEESILAAINDNTSKVENFISRCVKEEPLPRNFTKSVVLFADENNVIHRECELQDIEYLLKEKRVALLMSGFGGLGKTALAHVLYAKSADWFDCVGWVEYHKDLKNSLLAAMDLNDEIVDEEKRWKAISARLKNDSSSKIIFIDNVDLDTKQKQDPKNDMYLQEIAGWTNMTVVLTSRMIELRGYQTYTIGYLGNKNQIGPCVDLFYFYYDKIEFDKKPDERKQCDLVVKLVELAGFHTYAIELLARSAIYEDDLYNYLEKIENLGFKFPSLKISTNYSNNSATAAKQLRLLFNMQSRTRKERQILWDFSVLSEGTSLSRDDVMELFAYSENDLHYLCQDGWLLYERGQGFYVHPLVREAILLGLRQGKAPRGTVSRLLVHIRENTLISEQDTQNKILRKLQMVEAAENYIIFKSKEDSAAFYYRLGIMEFKAARKRLTSITYLEKALQDSCNISLTAHIRYQLGYVKSTTHQYRDIAKDDLQLALDMWQSLDNCEYEIAMAHDHLGYVLTDSESTYVKSKVHLTKAMYMRKSFVESNPKPANLGAYATTCDNLGYLLYKSGSEINESRKLLEEALLIREKLYETSEQYATDVAWTAFNLGKLLSKDSQYYKEAEEYFKRSLDIRRDLERQHPQMYTGNIILTLVSLAKIISTNTKRIDEVEKLFNEAITLRAGLDSDHIGFFSDEIEADIRILSELLNH